MWQLQHSWLEIVLRAFCIYAFVFALFRLMGKKQMGEMGPFDLVLLLIISESVSNGLSGEDNSVSAGLISAFTLLGLSWTVDYLSFKYKKFERFFDGKPQFVIIDGVVQQKILNKYMITAEELKESLRTQQVENESEVKFGVLETNGKISIIKK